jgi:TRAP-type mannitol/chloroaromatic compound transport system permease small subunit
VGRWSRWLILLMVLVGAGNAVARYVGPRVGITLSSNAYLELQWYLFSLAFLLAAAYTLRHDRHVRVDVLYGRLSPRARAWIDLIGTFVLLLPFALIGLIVTWPSVHASWAILEGSPDPGGLPRFPIKTVSLVAFALVALQGVAEAIRHIAFLRGRLPEPGAAANTTGEAPPGDAQ